MPLSATKYGVSEMPRVNPEILVWARETAGLTPEEAARKLGLSDSGRSSAVSKLAALETGAAEPSRSRLVKMSQQYRRPLLAFYLSQPPAKGDRGVDFRTLPAEHSAADEALLDALVRDVRARQSMVRSVLDEEDEAEPLDFIGAHTIGDGPAAVLASLQHLLEVDLATYRAQPNASAAFNLLRMSAEKAGIFVLIKGDLGNYHTAMDTNVFRGFSIADTVAPFIVINDQDARPAWSFTLLHETVHLLLGQTGVGSAQGSSVIERFCDDVAGEFLLPTSDFDAAVFSDSDFNYLSASIADLAGECKVSRAMVAYKAHRLGCISQEFYHRLCATYRQQWRQEKERQRIQSRERESGPNYYVVRRHRLGSRITELVRRMMADDALSTAKAARILGVKSRQVQPILNIGHPSER